MDNGSGQRPPQLGATFFPGGMDDFYMPEVVAPAPKRVIPEMPDNIQGNLARLELDGTPAQSQRLSGLRSPSPVVDTAGFMGQPSRNSSVSTLTTMGEPNQFSRPSGNSLKQAPQADVAPDQPTFSPFPRLEHRPPNVPPSDDEKEVIIENARVPVLNSTDPEMQLTWAQDALAHVEIVCQDASRSSDRQATRPPTPRTEHQLRTDAVNVVSFLADQHHPKAEFMRGMWLEFGKFSFRMDKKEAYRCYSRAAQKGYARAEYRMGMQFESSNDPVNAIKHYNLGVGAGDSASRYRLGMMTLLGQHGQQLDYRRGTDLIKWAAETADENAPQGAYVYGMLLARELKQISIPDQILPMDMTAARYNIEKAAYLGFAKAQTKMGAAYELCQLGCDFDPALSLHYNSLASKQGEPEADMAISKWFLCGHKDLFEKNDELAYVYAERAAQAGLPTAEFAMGYFYEVGIHVRTDLNVAKSWYTKAADHGYAEAIGRIEGISRSNTLSKKDHQDIAIARIRSTHGSQRGKRPSRYRGNEQMPAIPDSNPNSPMIYPPKPYPEDGRPYASPQIGNQRPALAAPYPEDSVFGSRPGPRPSNAATYSTPNVEARPDIRPASVAPVASAPLNGVFSPPSIASMRPPRSFSSQENLTGGRGRGTAPFRGGYGTPGIPGYRQPNSGLNTVQRVGSPASTPSSPQTSAPQLPIPQLPNIDIGFSAPLDPSGADRRGRLQKSSNRTPSGPNPGTKPLPTQAVSSSRNPQRLSSLPDTEGFTRQSRTASPSTQLHSRPGSSHGNHSPGGVTMTPSVGAIPPVLPPKVAPNMGPAPTPPPSGTSRPPGKGPKTFEEMGVPAQKQKDECALFEKTISTSRPDTPTIKMTLQAAEDSTITSGKAAVDTQAKQLQEQLDIAKGYERLLRARLAALQAGPSIDDLHANVTALELEKEDLTDHLERLRSGKVKPVPPAEKEAADKTWKEWRKKEDSRKRIFMEMWAIVLDELPIGQTKEQLWDELGLELERTDDDNQ
ncbi:MAG: hypothetical protein Q9170_001257 [Blastenia crenularia]